MPKVDVFLSHGFPRVWPPVVVVTREDPNIEFYNLTGAAIDVDLKDVPQPAEPSEREAGAETAAKPPVTIADKGPGRATIQVDNAKRFEYEYEVHCGQAGHAQGLSHPIIIIR